MSKKAKSTAVTIARKRAVKRNRRGKTPVKRNYKDSIFRMIFKEKAALLSLYNALNGTDYQDEEALEVNTLKNAIYMGRKNDVSFLIYGQVNVYEHQSTVNDNMPLRDLVYIGDIYSKFLRDQDIYSAKRITIPRPHFVVFYNGTRQQEAVKCLRLSDAFERPLRGIGDEEPELELKVRVININQGYNEELKESCRLLNEYTIFISRVREYARKQSIEDAVCRAIDDCIQDNILRDFLIKNRAEVSRMNIYEYDFDKHMDTIARENREDGFAEGKIEGKVEGKIESILDLLSDHGAVSEVLSDRIKSEKDMETLRRWIKLASKVDSPEQFAALIFQDYK